LVEQAVQLEQQAAVAAPVLGAPATPPTAAAGKAQWKLWAVIGASVVAVGVASWLLLRDPVTTPIGAVAVTLDDSGAYKDPVFLGTSSK
jgi:hypothetical protein